MPEKKTKNEPVTRTVIDSTYGAPSVEAQWVSLDVAAAQAGRQVEMGKRLHTDDKDETN